MQDFLQSAIKLYIDLAGPGFVLIEVKPRSLTRTTGKTLVGLHNMGQVAPARGVLGPSRPARSQKLQTNGLTRGRGFITSLLIKPLYMKTLLLSWAIVTPRKFKATWMKKSKKTSRRQSI